MRAVRIAGKAHGAQCRTTAQERTHRLPAPRAVPSTFQCNAEDSHDAGSTDHEGVSRLRHAGPTTRTATRSSTSFRDAVCYPGQVQILGSLELALSHYIAGCLPQRPTPRPATKSISSCIDESA